MFTASPIAPGRRAPRWAPTLVHARLGIAGVVLGLPAAIVTEFWFSSITLSLVVCAVVVYTIFRRIRAEEETETLDLVVRTIDRFE
jgi:hypothetical protein